MRPFLCGILGHYWIGYVWYFRTNNYFTGWKAYYGPDAKCLHCKTPKA